jgi:hypothetical protein
VKVVAKSDEYTIYQRRDQRFAVKSAGQGWINGDAKVAILVEHKLIAQAAPKPAAEAEPEAPEAAAAETEADASAEAAEAQGGSEPEAAGESPADEDSEAEK